MKNDELYEEEYQEANEDDTEIDGVSITSVDILQQKFRIKFRGYDVQDVDAFLELVAKEMERLSNENSHMGREIASLRRDLEKYKKKEESINAALLTVQIMSDDMKNNAAKEAENIVAKASSEAEAVVADARRDAENTISNANQEAENNLSSARKEAEELLKEAQENKYSVNKEMEMLRDEKQREASKVIEDAKARAEIMKQEFESEKLKIQEELNILKQKKNHFQSSLRSQIETHLKLLDSEQD